MLMSDLSRTLAQSVALRRIDKTAAPSRRGKHLTRSRQFVHKDFVDARLFRSRMSVSPNL